MDTYIKITQFLLSLSLLIILHEMGHFIPAKLFKTRVEKFYLFFDYKFSLFKKRIGETVYGIGWIPLGGYVKIAGMIDESMDKEQLKKPPQPWEFRSKPAWQRLIIMLGGVTVNFVLGIFIYVMMFNVWGEDYIGPEDVKFGFHSKNVLKEIGFQEGDQIRKVDGEIPMNVDDLNRWLLLRDIGTVEVEHEDGNTEVLEIPADMGFRIWQSGEIDPLSPRRLGIIDSVVAGTPAERAGIQAGDAIKAVNGQPTVFWNDLTSQVAMNPEGVPMSLTFERDGRLVEMEITPDSEKQLGVYRFSNSIHEEEIAVRHKEYTFGESMGVGISKAYWTLRDYMSQFKFVFTKKGATSLGGFITIGSIFPATWDWQAFWGITALLSIMLAFMNLLPIPALDGGHVVFTLYEMISGRKPSDKFLEYAQITGFIILVALLLFANGNDIYKWLTGQI